MTEEEINAVVEAYTVTNADKKGNTPAYQNYMKGMKDKSGKPMYKAATHLKGVWTTFTSVYRGVFGLPFFV